MGTVIPLRQYDQPPKSLKKPLDLSYEVRFIRNLGFWLVTGALLSIVLPTWLIWVGCIAAIYAEGKLKQKETK
jgi:hypothetical protein